MKKLFEEASAQISRYAESDMVREAVKTTKLHKLVVIYRGAEIVGCEEIYYLTHIAATRYVFIRFVKATIYLAFIRFIIIVVSWHHIIIFHISGRR